MGELIQLTRPQPVPPIRQLETGVFLLAQPPTDEILKSGDFFTASQFGIAGEMAGKSEVFGQGVMRDIAIKTIAKKREALLHLSPSDKAMMNEIYWLINDKRKSKNNSPDRLLLSHQLVHDVWAKSHGSELLHGTNLPTIGKVGQHVVSQLFNL